MSYILEALKKSQQERSRGQVPDLQSLHQSVAVSDRELPRWPYWALGISLLALAFLLGWLRPWANGDASISVVPQPTRSPVVAEMAVADKPNAHSLQKVEATEQVVVKPPVIPPAQSTSPDHNTVPADAINSVVDITQLPSQVQQSIPQMQFAGHVYSSNPLHRSVIINGRYMSEGDDLMTGMRLLQITPDSVIFDSQGQKFKVTVLHDWSFQ